MTYPFTDIVIIYNPNSTGDSKSNAKKFQAELSKKVPEFVTVDIIATKYAGHAEKIAKELSNGDSEILIISSSGDGGFNEVVNGIIAAGNSHAYCMVLPSGNANDHHEAIASREAIERCIKPILESVDAILVTGTNNGTNWQRYAHSYVGVGLTAYIGRKLTEAELNPIREKWLVLKYFLLFRSVTLRVEPDPRRHHYTSIIFGNIGRMSKIIKLAKESSYDDGMMEVYELRTKSLLKTAISLLFASTSGLGPTSQQNKVKFYASKPLEIQLDGEVALLDANEPIEVELKPSILRTIR